VWRPGDRLRLDPLPGLPQESHEEKTMSGTHDMDDLYKAIDALDERLQQLHGTLIAIAGGIEGITFLLSEDLKSRDPLAFERADQEVKKKGKDWLKMIREVNR
jgi:hypothetical protein